MENPKTNLQALNELVNPETFAFERGSDYGKGAPAKSTEITSKKMTDTLDGMVRGASANATMGVGVMNNYLGEDAIRNKRRKEHDHDLMDREKEDGTESNTSVPGHVQKLIRTLADEVIDLDYEARQNSLKMLDLLIQVDETHKSLNAPKVELTTQKVDLEKTEETNG